MKDLPLFNWRPPEKIIVFPSVRRRVMIQRTAIAAASTRNPENTIKAALARARASHERKGIGPEQVEPDMRALETAIRTTLAALLARQGRSA